MKQKVNQEWLFHFTFLFFSCPMYFLSHIFQHPTLQSLHLISLFSKILQFFLFMIFREGFKVQCSVPTPSKIIIDTHGGIQDILAILFAYRYIRKANSSQQIIGITCVNGKNSLDDAVRSALAANQILGTKIPVYRGQSQSLMLVKQYPKVHMEQRFAHLQKKLYEKVDKDQEIWGLVQNQKAVDFLTRACHEHKSDLGIVAFGPLTNIGLAHRLQEKIHKAGVLIFTGGQYLGLGNTVVGNIQSNFAADPLAAHILFQDRKNEVRVKDIIYLNPVQCYLSFCFRSAITECLEGRLNPQIEQILIGLLSINSIFIHCYPILSIIPLLQPKSICKKFFVYGEVVRDGDDLDGLLAVNWLKVGGKEGEYENFFSIFQSFNKEVVSKSISFAFQEEGKNEESK